jgi:GH15 family glucan-1,4-alpha-glucosidase
VSARRPERTDGYLPLRDYAAIGDGRTTALVGLDGSIDWLCIPNPDSPSVFGRILDAARGGFFELCPDEPFEAERRYQPGSNVLETTFHTANGTVRVTDALTLANEELAPLRELVRKIEGVTGSVPMRFRLEPRFAYGTRTATLCRRAGLPSANAMNHALAIAPIGIDLDAVEQQDEGWEARFTVEPGEPRYLAVAFAEHEPLVLPTRKHVQARLTQTEAFWPRWSERAHRNCGGPWADDVLRSVLALKLCVFSPSGAIVAAPTTSLPEWIGGARNWDYRFSWVRDSTWALDALVRLHYHDEARAFFWWVQQAARLTIPRLHVLYRVDGSVHTEESSLDGMEGYRGSGPVRIGNGAAEQQQLDVYGALLDCVWLYVQDMGKIDRTTGRLLARVADNVAAIWRQPDSGIWEVRSDPTHFIQSKAMCWVALDRACKLAERGAFPDRSAHWRREADACRAFVETEGWDADRNAYGRATTLHEADASLLTMVLQEFHPPEDPRLIGTVEAVQRELQEGPYVFRYRGADGLDGEEGAFLTCSFWLVDALARIGRVDEASALMDELCALHNDVGLFSEEVDRRDGSFLGNMPQALTHLALVNAALSLVDAGAA